MANQSDIVADTVIPSDGIIRKKKVHRRAERKPGGEGISDPPDWSTRDSNPQRSGYSRPQENILLQKGAVLRTYTYTVYKIFDP